ncbi:hypothetical protein C0Q70_13194 [Pomacea canaliculata]|uniref:PNO1 second type I KH domain-containing protein n=1 Tax=Pomacea canaliculata TaxID=400727 RepID=A0A2T7NWJ9_POMCA|nr:hypothetical protein C0Q70_13194 [Pomacea canaliculata]
MDQTANTGTESIRPSFPPVTVSATERKTEVRKVPVPPHRYTPLRDQWMKIFTPVVDHLKLQIRFNLKTKTVEIRTCTDTTNANALQKAADFVKAFTLGFEVDDAVALIRLDDLYLESFDIKDVKTLKGDHLSRAIGRLAGKSGKTSCNFGQVSSPVCSSKSLAQLLPWPIVESTFSEMGKILSKEKTNMDVDTYMAMQTVKSRLATAKKTAVEYFAKADPIKEPVSKQLVENMRNAWIDNEERKATNQETRNKLCHEMGLEPDQKLPSKAKEKGKYWMKQCSKENLARSRKQTARMTILTKKGLSTARKQMLSRIMLSTARRMLGRIYLTN